jgi:hypothetical protein
LLSNIHHRMFSPYTFSYRNASRSPGIPRTGVTKWSVYSPSACNIRHLTVCPLGAKGEGARGGDD